ncbi:MAG: DegT/DnrJ/EryC1/StrS family aminotransferase [Cyclobacteriaceae bacterium]
MNIPFFDLKRQNLYLKNELDEVYQRVLESGQFILGDQVALFEKQFSEYLGVGYCIGCGNGTDALEILLQALELGQGDEVLVPSFGWVSPYLAVRQVGATPVLVDVDPITGNMCPESLRSLVTAKSEAVIPIHLYGIPCDIVEIQSICSDHRLALIEDCAQAHGAKVGNTHCGAFGHAAIFSFYPTKNLGALGDAGAIVTDDGILADKIRSITNYGKVKGKLVNQGRNSRMDEIQAGILVAKLPYLTEWNLKRKAIAKRYAEASGSDEYGHDYSVYHQFVLRVRERSVFRDKLLDAGIETFIHYPFTINSTYGTTRFENAEMLAEQVVSLPVFPELTEEEIAYICDQLKHLRKFIL